MKRTYHVCSKGDRRRLVELLAAPGDELPSLLELLEDGRLAVETLMHELGRASLEAQLLVSAEEVAGPRARGKRGGEIQWYGRQRVACSSRIARSVSRSRGCASRRTGSRVRTRMLRAALGRHEVQQAMGTDG